MQGSKGTKTQGGLECGRMKNSNINNEQEEERIIRRTIAINIAKFYIPSFIESH